MRVSGLLLLFAITLAAQGPRGQGPQAGSVSGTVWLLDGKPAASLRIMALEPRGVGGADQAFMSIAETDENGRYHLENVPPGAYLITAGMLDVPTYFPGVAAESAATLVTVAPRSNLVGVDFRLIIPSALRFSGRIVRQDNAGQTIAATGPAAAPQPINVIRLNAPGVPVATAPVKPDGTFEFTNVRPGVYQVNVQPSARMPQLSVTLSDKDITGYELIVPLMIEVTGTVSVADGGPAPRIQLQFSNAKDPVSAAAPVASNAQSGVSLQAGPRFFAQVPAGANRVTVSNLPLGFLVKKIVAGSADLTNSPLTVTPAGTPPIQIVLEAGKPAPWVRITGRVTGRGVPNVSRINFNSQAVAGQLPMIFYLDGSFEIPKALPGAYQVGGPNTAQLNVPSGVSELTGLVVGVAPAADPNTEPLAPNTPSSTLRVSGRIVGRAKAAPASRVRMSAPDYSESRTATIYMDGSFEFQQAPAGTYLLDIIPPVPGALPVTITVERSGLTDVEIPLPDTREIAGRLTVEGNGPVPRSLVFSCAGQRIPVTVAGDGTFSVVLPDAGRVLVDTESLPASYTVSAMRYGETDLRFSPIRLTVADELYVALKAPGGLSTISGRVSGDRAPLDEPRVWLMDPGGERRAIEARIASDGAFSFAGVSPGEYLVGIAAPGIPATATATRVTVGEGQNVTDLDLKAPRLARGRVEVDGAGAAPAFGLRLGGGSTEETIVITPQRDGSFTALLPVGEHRASPVGLRGYAIRSARYGTTDMLKGSISISATAPADTFVIQLSPSP
ncbi:MAG TPA: hypothetical protein VFY29_12920 [Terriglobia bacterium]|nr:hypothetical protein [Terriglobia bacterium]